FEAIVNAGPDVPPDLRLGLPPPVVVGQVGGDVAGRDVRALADLGIADVGQVRHLRAGPDLGVLDLDEGPGLRAGAEPGAGPEVRERADQRSGTDLRVDGDDVRADLRAGGDASLAAQDREGMDRRVRRELNVRLDPGRVGVDDRHAGQHVFFVHARA